MKKILSTIMIVVMLFSMSAMAYAEEEHMTIDEAKKYLLNYETKEVDSRGKEITTWYSFDSVEDLEQVAAYISENGIVAFNAIVDREIKKSLEGENDSEIQPYFTDPVTAYANISGNGTHYVKAEGKGRVECGNLGTAEYDVELGYKITVANGKITGISSISFDIPYIGSAATWGNVRCTQYYRDKVCGVTANYDITKTLKIPIGTAGFEIKKEKANDIFALITNLK